MQQHNSHLLLLEQMLLLLIRQRNSIETWSKLPVMLGQTTFFELYCSSIII